MRDRMERLVLLPFAVGCMSESSVGVASPPAHKSRAPTPRSPPIRNGRTLREESDDETSSNEGTKSSVLPKPNISAGIQRMFKGFKNISHLFVYKEDMEEEEMDEIEIGLPTDVKHVTHIGWDGYATKPDNHPMNGCNRWDNLFVDPKLFSENLDLPQNLPSPGPTPSGLDQFEIWTEHTRDPQTPNLESRPDPVPVKV